MKVRTCLGAQIGIQYDYLRLEIGEAYSLTESHYRISSMIAMVAMQQCHVPYELITQHPSSTLGSKRIILIIIFHLQKHDKVQRAAKPSYPNLNKHSLKLKLHASKSNRNVGYKQISTKFQAQLEENDGPKKTLQETRNQLTSEGQVSTEIGRRREYPYFRAGLAGIEFNSVCNLPGRRAHQIAGVVEGKECCRVEGSGGGECKSIIYQQGWSS